MNTTDKKIRFGIIGFGRFAERAIAPAFGLTRNAELVAVQKRDLAEAEAKARQFGARLAFDSVEELVRHREVDAVYIVSANGAHCPETLAAARAGKHVLVEKPMALNVGEAERMIEECRRHGVKLAVAHMIRFSPLALRMKELLRSGSLGTPVLARADFEYDARLTKRSWLYERAIAGGGPVYDIGVHCLDTMRFVLDDEVEVVNSQLEPLPDATRTEEAALLNLKFSRGTLGSIYCSYRTSFRRRYMEVVGTEGMISASDFTVGSATIPLTITRGKVDAPSEVEVENIPVPNLYAAEIDHLAECIRDGREPLISGPNALQNQRVLDTVVGNGSL